MEPKQFLINNKNQPLIKFGLRLPELIGKLTPYVMQGKIKHRTHVLNGLQSSIDGLNLLLTGGNKGKLIVKL